MKKMKVKLLIAYVIAVFLAGTYFYVLYLAAHPVVSDEYRMFYMDHSLRYMVDREDLVVRPGEKRFADGKSDSENTFYGIGRGWLWEYTGHAMENTGYCYTGEENNYLLIKTNRSDPVNKIKLHILKSDANQIEIEVDGQNIGGYDIDSKAPGEVGFELPEKSPGDDGMIDYWVNIKPDGGETVSVDYLLFE